MTHTLVEEDTLSQRADERGAPAENDGELGPHGQNMLVYERTRSRHRLELDPCPALRRVQVWPTLRKRQERPAEVPYPRIIDETRQWLGNEAETER